MKKFRKGLLIASIVCLSGISAGLFGACKEDKETIRYTFNTNGGAVISEVEVEQGSKYVLPTPTKEGYSFEGWYTNENFSGEPVTEITAITAQTYYAKWVELYTITLDLNGGTLAQTKLSLKKGENVYDFLQSYVPEKEGFVFGAWFNGENELGKNTKINADLSLTAKYKVSYTVEIWQETLEGGSYVKAEQDVIGYEYPGVDFTSEQKTVGFREVDNAEAITRKVLSENASENVFRHYFDRETFTVTFHPNYPNSASGENKSQTVKYGVEVEVPSDYSYAGYCLIGWATSKTGDVVYNANYINNALFNKDGSEATDSDKFIPERNTSLYGVWKKGYTDMLYQSDDSIFVIDEGSGVAYLSRGDFFFKGSYIAERKEFRFTDLDKMIMGRLNDDGTYIYYDATRAETAYTLYEVGNGLVKTTTVVFDSYNGLSYYAEGKETSKGTYEVDGGYHVATFTEGDLAGKVLTLIINTITLDNSPTPIFQVRNEEEVGFGFIPYYIVKNGVIVEEEYGQLKFNGFGIATCKDETGSTTYSYTYDKETDLLELRASSSTRLCKLTTIDGKLGYMDYTEVLDNTFEIGAEEALVLDGAASAVYTKGSTSIEGVYTYMGSYFGGVIVSMTTSDGVEYAFMLTSETADEGTESETVKYLAEKKTGGYAEYLYMDAKGAYYAPMLVMNEPEKGKATLYGYTSEKDFVKVSVGTYTLNKDTGLYLYEATEYYDASNAISAFDLPNVKSFVYDLDTELNQYGLNVNYWYKWTSKDDDVTISFEKTYTSDLGGKLTLVGGFAFYEDKGYVLTGTYSTDDNGITTITTPLGSLWIEIYESSQKFLTLDSRPYKSYLIEADNSVNRKQYLSFDGKGGVTYVEITMDDQAQETGRVEYSGKVERLNETIKAGANVYQFVSGELTFKYLPLGDGSNSYYSVYNAAYNGQYNSETDGSYLELDGYGYMAYYTNADGETAEGRYRIAEENVVVVSLSTGTRYFDIKADSAFTLRGKEYGKYDLVENQMTNGAYVKLDGYGNLEVYDYVFGDKEYVDVVLKGTYERDGDVFTLKFKDSSLDVTLEGQLKGSYFLTINRSAVQTFVNKTDWSILVLDELGNATKYDANGKKDVGTYTLITDTLLYYGSDSGEDASCIYSYDRTKSTATPIKFTTKSYYTEEFEALLFSEAGFAIFNGDTSYFYNVVNGEVIMYRQAEGVEASNVYGFVEDTTFGRFEDVKEIGGKTYYANTGYAIEFTRKAESKDFYPVLVAADTKLPLENLTFAPSGEVEFSVVGNVVLNGQNYACYVTREIDDEGKAEMYVTIGAGTGSYRFDISVVYTGTDEDGEGDNRYEVTGMSWVVSAYSYKYLDTYYKYYLNDYAYGTSLLASYTNDQGYLLLHRVYNDAGEEATERHFVSGIFFEGSKMYDTTGSIVTVEKAALDESKVADGGNYCATFTGDDGYTYRIYFNFQYHSAFGLYGYILKAFTREEVLEANDGYTVIVERRIAADEEFNSKYDYKTTLKKDDKVIALDEFGSWGILYDKLYYMEYVEDENGKQTSVIYYNVSFTSNSSGTVEDEKVPTLYETATVFVEDVKIYYAADDEGTYAHISPTLGVTIFSYQDSFNMAEACTYDEETNIYTVEGLGNVYYKVKIVGEYITMELIETEE